MLSRAAVAQLPSEPFSKLYYNDAPSVAESEVSLESFSETEGDCVPLKITLRRQPLQWKFRGLTLWVEFEEFNNDLTVAIQDAAAFYGTERIPKAHATAIYGMEHLTVEQACQKLHQLPSVLPGGKWPDMERPVAVKQDIAVEGRPGQVCSIAWAELTLSTNEAHEAALDEVYSLFGMGPRNGPWTPHCSIAYDNPEDSVLSLSDTISYVAQHPTLLTKKRKVESVSLWSTEGKMSDWKCIDRIRF